MKLKITRSQEQKKGILGGNKGVNFKFDCRLELIKADENLIEHYNVRTFTLLWKDTPEGKTPRLNVADIINGRTFNSETLGEAAKLETDIIEACKAFNQILISMQIYGGEQIIDLQPPANETDI